MAFPLASVELNRVARRRDLYFYRSLIAAVAGIVLAAGGLAAAGSGPVVTSAYAYSDNEWVGRLLQVVATLFQIAIVLFITPILTSDSIAREKRDKTLGLLMLADFRGDDIYLAKFVSAFAGAESLILTTLPLMAFGAFFGGMAARDAVVQTLVASGGVAVACVLGLFLSASLPMRRSAFAATLILLCTAGFFMWFWPALLVAAYPDIPGWMQYRPVDWASPILWYILGALTLSMVIGTVWLLPRLAVEKGTAPSRRSPSARHRRRRSTEWSMRTAGRLLRDAGVERATALPTLLIITPVALLALPLIPVGGLWLLVVAVASADLLHSLYGLARSRAMEEILVAPLNDADLADALWFGATRRSWMYGILAGLSLIPVWFYAVSYDMADRTLQLAEWPRIATIAAVQGSLISVLLAFQMLALRAFCCAVSQRSNRPTRQTVYAALTVMGAHVGAMGIGSVAVLLGRSPIEALDRQYHLSATLIVAIGTLCALPVYAAVARRHWFEFNHTLRYWLLENLQTRPGAPVK